MLHLLMYSLFPHALENIYPLKFCYSHDDQDLWWPDWTWNTENCVIIEIWTSPFPPPRKINNQEGNQEIKYRERTVCPLTETGSKVYLLFEFPSSEWFCITWNKYKDHAVFLEWRHQVFVNMWPHLVVSENGELLESKWGNIMYLFVRCISLQHNSSLIVMMFTKIG